VRERLVLGRASRLCLSKSSSARAASDLSDDQRPGANDIVLARRVFWHAEYFGTQGFGTQGFGMQGFGMQGFWNAGAVLPKATAAQRSVKHRAADGSGR